MKDYVYIIEQVKKFHFTVWDENELRKCVDILPNLSRDELIALYQNRWLKNEKVLKDSIFQLLFKERIEKRENRIKTMNVDELIDNLHDENGYGKFIVLEMKDRYDTLDEEEKIKIINALSVTTKANQKWAEGKRRKLNNNKK